MILSSFSNSIISTQVSNMKMRKDKNRHWSYHAEVFTKGILRVSGKRRVDLNIRIVKDGVKDDREFLVYNSIFHQIKQYLSTKYANHSKVDIYLDNLQLITSLAQFYQFVVGQINFETSSTVQSRLFT